MKSGIRKYAPYSITLAMGIVVAVCFGCASISQFNEVAYEKATSLKIESLALMEMATSPYADYASEVDALKAKLRTAYEYANGRPNNEIPTLQWEKMIDPDKNLIVGFLNRWQEKSTLSETFIEDAKGPISEAFDAVIGLESGKVKPKDLEDK